MPDPSSPERGVTAPASLGRRLREARRAQRKTLARVAEESRLTKGFLSKLENDQASASVASLLRLCEALEVPVGALFEPTTGKVVRHDAYPRIEFGGTGMREYLLTPRTERRLQAILSEVQPGGGSGDTMYTLPTEVEFVYVLGGRLRLDLDGEAMQLEAGDSLTFPAATEHTFRAVGHEPARVLWVVTPALPDQGWQRPAQPSDTSTREPR
ncbi:MAG: XRE family transcriptional regulator [Actinomycetota bacterium]|nr:XRE family transcriptional regulator [Actinomycetota bacterium]